MKTKIIRLILCIIGVLGILSFGIPLCFMNSLNIGNATGIVICILFLVYGIKYIWINQTVAELWKRKSGRFLLSMIGGICGLVILIAIVITGLMIKANFQEPPENSILVVLGCRVYGTNPSLMLIERMDAAYAYMKEHDDAKAILSGGKGPGEDISEAECMYQYLTTKGIDPSRLYKEDNSSSTRENMQFSKDIIEDNQFTNEVAIVTNEFHEYRASKIAKDINLTPSAIPGKTAWWLFPTYYMRELYGIVYESVKN